MKQYDALPAVQKDRAVKEVMDRLKPSSGENQQAFEAARDSLAHKMHGMEKGTRASLAKDKLTDAEYDVMNGKVLQLRRFGDEKGKLSPHARLLLDKVSVAHFGEMTSARAMPAALELANLAGKGKALAMIKKENADYPTVNFFARNGYEANPVTSRRTADELLMYIHRVMHGPNSDSKKPGVAEMLQAFAPLEMAAPVLPTHGPISPVNQVRRLPPHRH